MPYEVGEKIQVKYLGDSWMTVRVANITKISEAQAAKWREYHPDMKAGEDLLDCSDSLDGEGEIRSFYSLSDEVRHMDGRIETAAPPPPPPPFEAKIDTGADIKPLHKIQLKQPRP